MLIRGLLVSALLALLLFPFLAILFHAGEVRLTFGAELLRTLASTFAQAVLSACLSLAMGLCGAFGILWAEARRARFLARTSIESFVLLPNLAPVLVILLSVMKFMPFATGLGGVVVVHTLLNTGLTSVAIARLLRQKVSGMAELAWIEGASGWRFFRRGVFPCLRADLLSVFAFVFAICFTSFAVPLMIGGSRATTIEVLIYQKIRIDSDWGEALGLSLFQLAAVMGLSFALRRNEPIAMRAMTSVSTPLLHWSWGLAPVMIAPALMGLGLVEGLFDGVRQVLSMEVLLRALPRLLGGSILVGAGTALLTAATLLLIAAVDPKGWLRSICLGYVAPSSALLGFAVLIVFRDIGWLSYFKIMLGVTLVAVPSFYRLQWDAVLRSLEGQKTVARTLGASEAMVYWRVVLPQIIGSACFIAATASLWAWGDFALSAVVAEKTLTLAMLIQGLMNSYRTEAATVLIWLSLFGGATNFAFFMGVGRVLGAKSPT